MSNKLEQTTWIPVNKKLLQPQKYGDKDYSEWVQITLHIGEDNDVVGRAFYCFSEKKWYTNELGVGEVTAWMSLPKPYKEDIHKTEETKMTKSKNKMEQVALIFFKKLGERFWVVTQENEMLQYVFSDGGLFPIKDGKLGVNDGHMLIKMLTGEVDVFSKS